MSSTINDALDGLRTVLDRLEAVEVSVPPDSQHWDEVEAQSGKPFDGRRVLLLGPDASSDVPELIRRGATPLVHEQSSPTELASMQHAPIGLVHCVGLLHRTLDPMGLLCGLRRVISPDGTLIIGTMVLSDLERSELLRFVPDRHREDPSWWFVPGRLALRWMLQTAGFDVRAEFGEREGPRGNFAVRSVCVVAKPAVDGNAARSR